MLSRTDKGTVATIGVMMKLSLKQLRELLIHCQHDKVFAAAELLEHSIAEMDDAVLEFKQAI